MDQLNIISKSSTCHGRQIIQPEKKNLSKRHRKSGIVSTAIATDSQSQKTDSESDRSISPAIDTEQAELSDPAMGNQQINISIEQENENGLAPIFEQKIDDKNAIDRGH